MKNRKKTGRNIFISLLGFGVLLFLVLSLYICINIKSSTGRSILLESRGNVSIVEFQGSRRAEDTISVRNFIQWISNLDIASEAEPEKGRELADAEGQTGYDVLFHGKEGLVYYKEEGYILYKNKVYHCKKNVKPIVK